MRVDPGTGLGDKFRANSGPLWATRGASPGSLEFLPKIGERQVGLLLI
jgi:hypothetical protein